ncbi:MAG TPA: hypothetical protein VFV19_17135 [Candidatus Polarisedimenticolaceae bacterium]|nr:hypothetical protein [Candidatus Polarisedimenticolaceae bacterium]
MLLFVRREPAVSVLQASSERDLGLCRDMKALKAGRRRAVIICGPRELRAVAFESGCDAFVAEGPDPLPLLRAVRRLLTVARPASSGHGIEVVA